MIEATNFRGEQVQWQAGEGSPAELWLHAHQPSKEEIGVLDRCFPMNELALEDALELGHASHYEKYPEGDFITFRSLKNPEALEEASERLSIFLYEDCLLTLSVQDLPYLARGREVVAREIVDTAAEVAFELLDLAAISYTEFVVTLEQRIDDMEQGIFVRDYDDHEFITKVFDLKQRLNYARRLALEGRDALGLLARHASASEEDRLRFRDVHDTLARLIGRLDTGRDNLSNLLSIHASLQSQRMNEVMRTLAAVSTIFLPLTFLAGVWGMNFAHMPELSWPTGYAFAWATFVLLGGILAWIFKRRGWW